MQLRTTMNVATHPLLDWVHIGLQFQVEHHLFPRLPRHNLRKARALVKNVVPRLADRKDLCHQGCHEALDNALITAPDARDPVMAEKLAAVAGRVLG